MKPNPSITAAIHQPTFLPWLGFFYKMMKSDVFVLLDNAQYNRRGFVSRVKIKNDNGEKWLTVPVKKKGLRDQLLNQAQLVMEPPVVWKRKTLGSLQTCYGKAPYFKNYFPAIEAIIQEDHLLLTDMNQRLITQLAQDLKINTKIINASDLPGITGQASHRLATICHAVNASKYLSSISGHQHLDTEPFKSLNIELIVNDFKDPVYPQMFETFIPGLSAVDLLFNCGPDSAEILRELD